jgi:hypothetical protein
MEMDRQFVEERSLQVSEDVGVHDVKFALTGIGICIAIAILLMLVS